MTSSPAPRRSGGLFFTVEADTKPLRRSPPGRSTPSPVPRHLIRGQGRLHTAESGYQSQWGSGKGLPLTTTLSVRSCRQSRMRVPFELNTRGVVSMAHFTTNPATGIRRGRGSWCSGSPNTDETYRAHRPSVGRAAPLSSKESPPRRRVEAGWSLMVSSESVRGRCPRPHQQADVRGVHVSITVDVGFGMALRNGVPARDQDTEIARIDGPVAVDVTRAFGGGRHHRRNGEVGFLLRSSRSLVPGHRQRRVLDGEAAVVAHFGRGR